MPSPIRLRPHGGAQWSSPISDVSTWQRKVVAFGDVEDGITFSPTPSFALGTSRGDTGGYPDARPSGEDAENKGQLYNKNSRGPGWGRANY